MDFQNSEPGIDGGEACRDHPAEAVGEAATTGLPRGVSEALADPIVQALIAADRADPKKIEELLRRVAVRLASDRAAGALSTGDWGSATTSTRSRTSRSTPSA